MAASAINFDVRCLKHGIIKVYACLYSTKIKKHNGMEAGINLL